MHLPHLVAFDRTPVVFLTACIHRRLALLATDQVHGILRESWLNSAALHGWYVGDYVLMPDHLHLFAFASRESCSLPSWVQRWKGGSSLKINRSLRREGAVWQPDYFDRYLRSHEDYRQKWTYVEQNPVRKGLVDSVAQWPYRGFVYDVRYRGSRD